MLIAQGQRGDENNNSMHQRGQFGDTSSEEDEEEGDVSLRSDDSEGAETLQRWIDALQGRDGEARLGGNTVSVRMRPRHRRRSRLPGVQNLLSEETHHQVLWQWMDCHLHRSMLSRSTVCVWIRVFA